MERRNPYVTTIGFKKDDPDHVYVAELLNSMGRGKAQYIVKAVLVYQRLQQQGELPQTERISYNYEDIKRIVLQVIEERERQTGNPDSILHEAGQEPVQKEENNLLQGLDEDALNGIMASLAAFQEQF